MHISFGKKFLARFLAYFSPLRAGRYKSHNTRQTHSDKAAFEGRQRAPSIPIAKSSTPLSRRLWAGRSTSSCDLPSVIRIPILGTSSLAPDSGLKLFSRM